MSRIDHPLIAIDGLRITRPKPGLRLDDRYAESVLQAGGVPLAIPPVGGPADVERLLERVDGLLLSGGDDFDTARLGLGPTHPEADPVPPEKQDFDMVLVERALALGVPVLGICYGMQLLGLAGGSGLLQHLPEDRPGGRAHAGGVVHEVETLPDTKLVRILGVDRIPVVSRHHQALSHVEKPWVVSAQDDEGLIEAIERPDLPFAIGVQWHPELSEAGSGHERLFRGLVGAAGMAAARRLVHF